METIDLYVSGVRLYRWVDDAALSRYGIVEPIMMPMGASFGGPNYYDYSKGAWCAEVVVPISHFGFEQVVVCSWGEKRVVDSKLKYFDKDGWKNR